MDDFKKYFDANKDLWNQRTAVHKDSAFYDVEGFKKGDTSLKQIELKELGDVKGKKLLHLQCHFGMDTMSWARLGAEVTGIDFSEEAIDTANQLSAETGIPAKFICANLYDLKDQLQEKFDIVYTSYGVICWLPDLEKWADLIARNLKPGGIFYMAEFHPVLWMFDENFDKIKYYYHNKELITVNSEGTYADKYAAIKAKEYSWNHSLSEVINVLISRGLRIEFLNEFSYSPFNCFNHLEIGLDGNYRIRGQEDKIPMVYSIKATRM
jgi:2-polyprenyl-3-methyl-5-hydroxy-6-metoxy-1,4-benzoquinol methylase